MHTSSNDRRRGSQPAMDLRETIARNIAEERDTIRITWRELSSRSGVSVRRLKKPTRWTVDEVFTIARALGCHVERILGADW